MSKMAKGRRREPHPQLLPFLPAAFHRTLRHNPICRAELGVRVNDDPARIRRGFQDTFGTLQGLCMAVMSFAIPVGLFSPCGVIVFIVVSTPLLPDDGGLVRRGTRVRPLCLSIVSGEVLRGTTHGDAGVREAGVREAAQ